jgi:hypothetical protein
MSTRPSRASAVKAMQRLETLNKALKEFDRSVIIWDDDDESDSTASRARKRHKSAREGSEVESNNTELSGIALEHSPTVEVMAESDSDEEDENEDEGEDEENEESSDSSDNERGDQDDEDFVVDPNESSSDDNDEDENEDDEFDYDLFDAEVGHLEYNVSAVLYSKFGIKSSTYKEFLRGAMVVHNVTNDYITRYSIDDVDTSRPFLICLKLPFATDVSSDSLKTAIEPIRHIDWDKRKNVLATVETLIPTGGIAFKTFHYIRPIVCYLAAAYALSHALLDTSPYHEEEDILDVVFGDLSAEELETKHSIRTVDGAVAKANTDVQKWVNDLNELEGDHEFIRRIICSISTLNAPSHVRAKHHGGRTVEPIYYGLCDTKIVNHEGRRFNNSNTMLLRVMLVCANDNSDNVKHRLHLIGKRLRVRGAGGFHGNICTEYQIQKDPTSTAPQYYHGCVASMNSIQIDVNDIVNADQNSHTNVNTVIANAFDQLISPSTALGKALFAIGASRDGIDDDHVDDSTNGSSMSLSPLTIKPVEGFEWRVGLKLQGRATRVYNSLSVYDGIVKALKRSHSNLHGVKTLVIFNSLLTAIRD